MEEEKVISLILNTKEINYLLQLLGKQPFVEVDKLINKIYNQSVATDTKK